MFFVIVQLRKETNTSMRVFKFPNAYKRHYSSSSIADTEFHSLNHRFNYFLSNNNLDSASLLPTHAYIITTGHAQNKFFASKLISSYASLNQPHSSAKVFDSLYFHDHFLWNSIIKAHFSNGQYSKALEFFSIMRASDTLPNEFTVPMIVSACAELDSLLIGMNIHGLVLKSNLFNGNSAVGSSFVYMYSKCGDLEKAALVFDEIPLKDVVSWTALVIGHVQNGETEKGLECLCNMHRIGGNDEKPNIRTFEGGFQACGDLRALVEGKCLHGLALKLGLVSSHIIQSAILSMYSKCGSAEDSYNSFHDISDKDLFSWTSIISVYARLGCVHKCLQMFTEMQVNEVYPDGTVISCLISCFSNSMRVFEGKVFHGFILRKNYEVDQIVHNALLSMYCKFGLLSLAEKLFNRGHDQEKDSWNLMILGYEKAELEINCINLFREMQRQGIESELNSLTSVISSCSKMGAINFGRSIHCHVIKKLLFENVSLVNSLINLYGKCGILNIAESLFDRSLKDVATWSSMISSYTHNGKYLEALNLFDKMVQNGLKPNHATLVTVLCVCAQSSSVEKGRKIHDYIRETGIECNVSLDTALVDMYGKCGQIETAREIFDSMNEKDVISWNAMISCYGMHGHGKSAIEIFQLMEKSGVRPNELTFLVILSACAHAGLVNEGKLMFGKMKEYSVTPKLKHYACMVDLFGRTGLLDDAKALVLSMPIAPDSGVWASLLTACKIHINPKMGIEIAKRAIEAFPENDGYYVMISDLYSSVGMWEEVEKMRKVMKDRGVKKTVGWSSV